MKNRALHLVAPLALLFIVVAIVQSGLQELLFKSPPPLDLKKAGRAIFRGIQLREKEFWAGQSRSLEKTAAVFARLLVQPPGEANAALWPPEGPEAASPPLETVAAPAPAFPPRFRTLEGGVELGVLAPGAGEMPPRARVLVAALPQAREYFSCLVPPLVAAFFVSRDNWLAVVPGRKAMELPASGQGLIRDPLYSACTPAQNPGRGIRFAGPHYDDLWKRWVVSLAVPVYLNNVFLGVAGHDLPVESALAVLAGDGDPAAPEPLVLDDALRVVLHRDLAARFRAPDPGPGSPGDFLADIRDPKARELIAVLEKERTLPGEREFRFAAGRGLILSYRHPGSAWHTVLRVDESDLSAAAAGGGTARILLSALVLLAALSALFVFLRATVTSPLARIHEGLLHFLRSGSAPVRPRRRSFFPEVERLAVEMDRVLSRIHEQIGETSETREQLEKLMQTSQSAVITMDARLRPTSINPYGLERFRLGGETIGFLRPGDFFERAFIREAAAELKAREQIVDKETTMTLKTGEKFDVSLSLAKVRDARGRLGGFLAVIADISKRKKAEIDLKNQILFSRQIFQSIPEMIIIVDRRLRVTFINKRARELIQAGGAAVIGQNLNSILTKNSIESGFDELVRNVLEHGNSVHRINTLSPVLKEENYVDLIVEPLKSGGVIIGGIIMLRDISEWRSLTAQLRSLQGFLQKLINASPYAVISINEHYLITTWNSAAEKILGISFGDAFGKNLYALLPLFDKYKDVINEIMILKKTIYLNDEQIFIGEEDFKVANLTLYPVTAEQNGAVIHIEDVSALKKLESSLIHAQKMESLGLLTSHIIHDFNNLLSGIMGYASLLEKKIADNPKVQKYVSTIITSSERASTLINQLLNFSRKKMAEKEILSVNDLIKEALDFLAMNLKTINLDIQLYHGQILLRADKTKISQVLINLIINARDALENAKRPIIRLRTDLVEISNQSNLLDGKYAQIEISDNGSGISRESQKKIFEPFFTTKGQGRGTGLGLAIVREIIHDYNGRIELESEIGQGATFTILLPVFEEGFYPAAALEAQVPAVPMEGLVLLIDDEEVVREIGSDMLKTLGLKCLAAANGAEGIELFKKNSAEIKLVILDIEMPGITGEKVFQILREINPVIKILIASGYGREYLESEIFKGKISHFIPKPFKIEQLSYQVNKLLGGRDV